MEAACVLTAKLAVGFGFTIAASLVCVAIGVALLRRPRVEGDAQRAATAFAVWWVALGVDNLLNTATFLLGALGMAAPWLVATLTFLAVGAICVMLWGLVTYLLYLYTGLRGVFRGVTMFYAGCYVLMTALIARLGPNGVTVGEWTGAVAYANEPPPVAGLLVAVFFLLPPILGALAYLGLAFRVRDAYRRFRVILVGGSLFVWLTTSIVLSAPGDSLTGQIVGRTVAATAIAGLVLAYFTPRALRRRLGADEPDLHPVPRGRPDVDLVDRAEDERRRAALAARARELV